MGFLIGTILVLFVFGMWIVWTLCCIGLEDDHEQH